MLLVQRLRPQMSWCYGVEDVVEECCSTVPLVSVVNKPRLGDHCIGLLLLHELDLGTPWAASVPPAS